MEKLIQVNLWKYLRTINQIEISSTKEVGKN
jgi:hypothetical protein